MIIHSSSLALRFYKSDGWSRELLESMLVAGALAEQEKGDEYFILQVGGRLDMQKLLTVTTKVVRRFDDRPEESDASFLKRLMW